MVLLETRTPKKLREIVADHAQTAVLIAVHPVIHVSLTVALQSVVGFGERDTVVYNLFSIQYSFHRKTFKTTSSPIPKSQK